ncbi:TPA: hypothetical protein NGU14_004426 [Vibrio parahaemolyticus]|nr:hypothetical protein [Vibrio parahaemolyticus]ELB2132498.1 hypothetical protein [Vibrio parahaemolyticus]ELB2147390.1 hypothetical protein [Vibrio parahaemolyticus]ELB2240098.1 hypothetical protein [Vibrio parahaemolyticus]HCE2452775.1 hypothetical protein [Vibrio parahaemolyticus]
MEEKHWIDYVVAVGSVATPIFVLFLTAVGWKFRQSIERKATLEEKLRDDRIEIYNQILEPFIILLMSNHAWLSDKKNKGKDKDQIAVSQMLSLDYRKTSFKLSLIGSDEVVCSFNNLMQHFYSRGDNTDTPSTEELKKMMSLLGSFLLEIRKSMGNETTNLDNWGMLEWFMTDARKMRDGTYA